jgi:hypothetical protein
MKAIQQPHVDGKRLGRPRDRGARSTPESKIAPVPDFSEDERGQLAGRRLKDVALERWPFQAGQ